MQKFLQKNILVTLFFFRCISAHSDNQTINTADSLLMLKKYAEAELIYTQILQTNEFPSAIFLKMAFIEEKKGNYEQALYFLNNYYLRNPSEVVLRKMESLAQPYGLKGYKFTDKDFFRVLYDRFYIYLAGGITFCSLLIFMSLLLRKRRKQFIPVRRNIAFALLLVAFLIFINLPRQNQYIIISHENTYLRNAPSSGSGVMQIINKGHRLPFIRQADIWIETEWNNEKVFVHNKNVLVIAHHN